MVKAFDAAPQFVLSSSKTGRPVLGVALTPVRALLNLHVSFLHSWYRGLAGCCVGCRALPLFLRQMSTPEACGPSALFLSYSLVFFSFLLCLPLAWWRSTMLSESTLPPGDCPMHGQVCILL
jgi:hypothetical protein